MKITYDKTIDALNIVLKNGRVARTLEVAPEIMLDLDRDGRPLHLEIIGASEKIGKRNFSTFRIGHKSVRVPTFA